MLKERDKIWAFIKNGVEKAQSKMVDEIWEKKIRRKAEGRGF